MRFDQTATVHAERSASWGGLIRIEPKLSELEQSIRRENHRNDFWPAYETMKRRLSRLVGWGAQRPELGGSAAWDVAHSHLLLIMEGATP